jgi:hypothetical protein
MRSLTHVCPFVLHVGVAVRLTKRCVCDQWAAAPVIVLRIHVGTVREQRRRRWLVPCYSGHMERRPPAVQRARPHTAARTVGACACALYVENVFVSVRASMSNVCTCLRE